MDKHNVSATIILSVSDKDIDDIMVTALEGGITHWCSKVEVSGEYLGEYASDQISRGGSLKLYDIKSRHVFELTLEKFLTGLRLWIEFERTFRLNGGWRLDVAKIDAEAANYIIQYALFGDVIYG
mgnify:CR=1 FL=1